MSYARRITESMLSLLEARTPVKFRNYAKSVMNKIKDSGMFDEHPVYFKNHKKTWFSDDAPAYGFQFSKNLVADSQKECVTQAQKIVTNLFQLLGISDTEKQTVDKLGRITYCVTVKDGYGYHIQFVYRYSEKSSLEFYNEVSCNFIIVGEYEE